MVDRFVVRVAVRGYEADANGHVAGNVLLQYGQHARWECLRAAGVDQGELTGKGIGPVSLEERILSPRDQASPRATGLDSRDTAALLRLYGVAVPDFRIVGSADEAVRNARHGRAGRGQA